MRMHKVLTAGAALVALGLVFLTGSRADDDEKKARGDVTKLADLAAKDPEALYKKAAEYAKSLDSLEDVMNLMKKRTKENKTPFGFGPKPTGTQDDGIEVRIQNLSKKSPSAAQLKKDKADLLQMLDRTLAIGEIALGTPKKKEGDKDPKDWKEYAERMVKETKELRKAIEEANPPAVKKSAQNLNSSCTDCHGKFRD